ncbi:uncharacterized protein LOC110024587 [Phalaenopsis equestris]|uniref:uncharacterized protein LOC110024587 n=1 Tax=Phalaenopsis equestris TaxID=78828 RepID=UPI0009E519FE|nr:uncharacterized protein LOC110024587 [Phalaenopsis equestris]XP_020580295.1 uncharacterized protein LOC110024587 [Phalaenopsis equestris]
MRNHGHRIPLEVMGTMIEMADVAWNALEHRRERKIVTAEVEDEIARLHSENHRLKALLAENAHLIHDISQIPSLINECPSDLYSQLLAAVNSTNFLETIESLDKKLISGSKADLSNSKYTDQNAPDVLIRDDEDDSSCWVLVMRDAVPYNLEEMSEIDTENYVIITEENVVDGIANFMARCILENPKSKSISPQELQKAVSKALGDMKGRNVLKSLWDAGIVIYTLSTWGIFLTGLYRHRAIVKSAAKAAHASTKFVLKAL